MSIVEVISPDYIKVMSGVGIGVVATLAVTWVRQVDIAHAQQRISAFIRSEDDQDARFLAEHKRVFASAPVDPDVTGELVAVEETGLTFALSDRPAADEDEVGDEQPGEALAEAPARLWSRQWTWLTDLLADFADLFKSDERRAAEFWTATEPEVPTEPAAELEAPAEVPTQVEPEPVQIVRRDRFRPAGETDQFPYVKVAGAPRHAAPEPEMPAINATVPTQRTGDEA